MSMVRRVFAAVAVLLALSGRTTTAAEPAVEVFTTSTLPVTNARDAAVYYVDAITLLEQHLSLNLPPDPVRAQQLVAQRMTALGPELESRTRSGAAGLARAAQLGLQRAPAVVFDGMKAALARGTDVVLIDSAGRLHTRSSLMEELGKVRRVISRELPGAPHETLLVVDATTGQNAVSQGRTFAEAVGLTGIVVTKLDGTARGGVAVALRRELGLPLGRALPGRHHGEDREGRGGQSGGQSQARTRPDGSPAPCPGRLRRGCRRGEPLPHLRPECRPHRLGRVGDFQGERRLEAFHR